MFALLTQILVFTTLLGSSLTNDCGDWVAYKDEKCFKAFDKAVDESTAEEVCRQNTNESVLAVIKTIEEQQFIDKYLKTINIADNVWIGIKKTNNVFKYSDGNDIKYNNWAKDRPLKNSNENNCVEISVDEPTYGKWFDDRCKKKNAVLCERIQPWSVASLRNILLEKIDQLTKLIQLLQTQQQNSNEKIDQLKRDHQDKIDALKKVTNILVSNTVPIGFIYTQFSGQSDPKTLWPNTEWENISANYSGLFFRAEGGQDSSFGQIQEQQTQSFQIYNHWTIGGNWTHAAWLTITDKPLEHYILTAYSKGDDDTSKFGINIKHNNEEIRPRNQAIRIWRRIH